MSLLRVGRFVSAAAVAAALAFSSGVASAEPQSEAAAATAAATTPSSDDAVYMKDGSVLRGVLVEMMPGDHASVRLPTGQVAVVRWDAITRVDRGTRADAKAPAPAVPTTVQTAGAGQALVHLDSEKALQIETHVVGREWRFACEAPCDIALDLDKTYRIVGDGVRTSPSFRIAATPGGRVVLDVATASRAGLVGGIVMASVGVPVLIIGAAVVIVSSATSLSSGDESAKNTGWIVFGVGVGGVVGGVLLIVNNARTSVVQSNGNTIVRRDGARADAYVRAPAWNDARLEGRSDGRAPAVMIPLYSGRF